MGFWDGIPCFDYCFRMKKYLKFESCRIFIVFGMQSLADVILLDFLPYKAYKTTEPNPYMSYMVKLWL